LACGVLAMFVLVRPHGMRGEISLGACEWAARAAGKRRT